MTKEELIQFKVNQFLIKRDGKGLVAFIAGLIDSPKPTLRGILDEFKVEADKRVVNVAQVAVRVKAVSDEAKLVDVDKL